MATFKNLSLEKKKLFLEEHYYYEVVMVYESYFLKIRDDNPKIKYLNNVRLESFIFHTRNLIEFYYEIENSKNNRKYDSDAKAIDYFSINKKWIDARPDIRKWRKLFFERAGKEMAHLTYSRLDVKQKEKEWNIYEIAKPIKNISLLFIENIDEEYKTEKILDLHNCLKDSEII